MGNTKSFEQHNDFKDIQHNYTYEKKYNDSRFGEVKLLKENTTSEKIFQKDFSSNTPKEFEDYVNEIRDCSALSHPNVLKVFGYNSKKEDLFCADFYKLSLFFESFESDLEQEIAKRSHNKDYFPEKELWYILDSVASGCAYLQANKIPHRDVRPYNVFITQSKDYKISPTSIFRQNYNPAYFENFDALEAKSRYYSPELLAHFSKPQAQRTPIDDYKSDVFSLGMTMLEAGLLQKVPDAYNYDKFEVRSPRIQEGLNQLRERYSENFVKTIESTLDFNPQTRLDFTRLDTELGRYRRDIREQARGANQTPTSPAVPIDQRGTHLRMASPERPVRSAAPPQYEDDLDRRVREAVKKSEEVIKRSSPTKYANKNLDPYIQSYLRNDLRPNQDQPLLSTISPFLTSESKYTTTLTIEQPNYGRESQPINFNQPQPGDPNIDSFKRSAYADLASNLQPQTTLSPGGYTQPGGLGLQSAASFGQAQAQPQSYTNYGQTTTYDAAPRTYGQPESYLAGTSGLGNTGLGNYATTAPYGSTGLGQSGVNANYSGTYGNTGLGASGAGTNNYASTNYGLTTGLGQTGGYGTPGGNAYVATAVDASNRNYVNEADDLSRRIAERLQQSKQLTS